MVSELQATQERCRQLERANAAFAAGEHVPASVVSQLEHALRRAEIIGTEFRAANEVLHDENAAHAKVADYLRKENATFYKANLELRSQNSIITSEMEALRAETSNAHAGAETLRDESSALRAELDRTQEAVRQLQSECEALKRENARREACLQREREAAMAPFVALAGVGSTDADADAVELGARLRDGVMQRVAPLLSAAALRWAEMRRGTAEDMSAQALAALLDATSDGVADAARDMLRALDDSELASSAALVTPGSSFARVERVARPRTAAEREVAPACLKIVLESSVRARLRVEP